MGDILKLGLTFLGIMAVVIIFGLILSSCTGGDDSKNDDKKEEKTEEVQESSPTPEPEATNPLTVRGTATASSSAPSITGGVYEAVMYEAKPNQTSDDAVQVGNTIVEDINHSSGLPTQWDFRVTAPNYSSDNTYYVYGVVYKTVEKQEKVMVGKCKSGGIDEMCSVQGSGKLTNFWMDLVSAVDL